MFGVLTVKKPNSMVAEWAMTVCMVKWCMYESSLIHDKGVKGGMPQRPQHFCNIEVELHLCDLIGNGFGLNSSQAER